MPSIVISSKAWQTQYTHWNNMYYATYVNQCITVSLVNICMYWYNPQYDVAIMIIECCSQERSYRKFFGLLGQAIANRLLHSILSYTALLFMQRFFQLNPEYVEQYVKLFQEHVSSYIASYITKDSWSFTTLLLL